MPLTLLFIPQLYFSLLYPYSLHFQRCSLCLQLYSSHLQPCLTPSHASALFFSPLHFSTFFLKPWICLGVLANCLALVSLLFMLAPLHVHSPPTFLPSASFNSRCLGSYWIYTTQALNQFFFINTLLVSLFDNDICWFVVLAFFVGCYLLF